MAITVLPSPLLIGGYISPTSPTTYQLDAAGEKIAWVFKVPKTTTITGIAVKATTVTSSGDFDFRVETVSTTDGNPTTTLWGTNTNLSATVSATGIIEITFTAGASVTMGDIVAIVISRTSGNVTFAHAVANTTVGFPYSLTHNGTSWSKVTTSQFLQLAIKEAGGYIPFPSSFLLPVVSTFNINTGTSPDEVGVRFNLPFAVRIVGASIHWNYAGTGRSATATAFDSGGSALSSNFSAHDEDISNAVSGAKNYDMYLTAAYDLAANTDFTVAMKPTTASINAWNYYDFTGFSGLKAITLFDSYMTTVYRVDGGSWSTYTDRHWGVQLIVSGIDFGGTAGGLLTHPGMSGGMRA